MSVSTGTRHRSSVSIGLSSFETHVAVIRTPQQNYILKTEDEGSATKIQQDVREAIEFWYSRKNPEQGLKEIKEKDASQKSLVEEAYKSVSLEDRSDSDIIIVLKHREASMRSKAISILENRLNNPKNSQDHADLVDKLRSQPRLLINMFQTDDLAVLAKSSFILAEIIDANLCVKLRQVGAIDPLCKILNLPLENETLLQYLFYVLLNVTQNEENRDAFRSVSGLIPIVPFLNSSNSKIQLIATRTLMNLSSSSKNQPIIVRGGATEFCFKNLEVPNNLDLLIETLFLIRNLASCEQGRDAVLLRHLTILASLLNAEEAYPDEERAGTKAHKQSSQIQKLVLHSLFEYAVSDRNKSLLGQLQIIAILRKFFLPMNPQNGLKWNFPVFERVLALFNSLVSLESLRTEFLDVKGQALVSRIVQCHDEYPEECVLNAAQIIITTATSATPNQQSYAVNGVDLLLGLLQQNPDKQVIQQLVSQLLKSIAVDGHNKAIILERGAPEVFIRLLKESSLQEILENCANGLAALSAEEEVVSLIIERKLVPVLVGLLQLNLQEIQLPVVDILSNVVRDDTGATILVKSGGMLPLVALLHSRKSDVLEGTIITFAKILFHKEKGEIYRKYFYEAEGEVALLKLLDSKENRVLSPCLSVLSALSQTRDGRVALMKAGAIVKIEQLEREGKMAGDDQNANLLRIIKVNFKKEEEEHRSRMYEEAELERKQNQALEAERKRIEDLVRSVQEQTESKKNQRYWLKIELEGLIKVFPVTLQLTYAELVYNIKAQFGIQHFKNLTWSDNKDVIALEDQSDFNYVLDLISNGGQPYITVHPVDPVITVNDKNAKLDEHLKELTHKQLRELIKIAIVGGADIVPQLKQYLIVNRQANKNKKTETVPELVPLGTPSPDSASLSVQSTPVSTPIKSASTVTSRPVSLSSPPPLAPPPPPPVITKSAQSLVKKNLEKDKPSNFIEELQQGPKALNKITEEMPEIPDLGSNLLNEISMRKSTLKHLEAAVSPIKTRDRLMEDIKNKETTSQIKLLAEGLSEGRKYWIRQPETYVEELRNAILLDYEMIQIIYDLLQHDETTSFKDKFETIRNKEISQSDVAKGLLQIGFNIRTRTILKDDNTVPLTEYIYILPTSDLPTMIILKTMLSLIKGLPSEYATEKVKDELSFISMEVEEVMEDLVLPFTLKKENTCDNNNNNNSINKNNDNNNDNNDNQ